MRNNVTKKRRILKKDTSEEKKVNFLHIGTETTRRKVGIVTPGT